MYNKYKEEYAPMLIKHMSGGMSFESFGAVVDCCVKTLYNWKENNPEFDKAYNTGYSKAFAFFERALIADCVGGKITVNGKERTPKTNPIIFALRTRFHKIYGERHAVDLDTKDLSLKWNPKE